ncbi:MAG TPA: hypothetical protein VGN52_00305 [Burkholderiales bacterium]|jgi:hypothetical protein
MKTSLKLLAAAGLALATLSGTAMARDNVSFGLSIGAPPPPPVYVAPAPVYVAPAPAYVEPAYVAPPPVVAIGVGPGYHHHHRDHRDWHDHDHHDHH